jgi:hypothetical protein
MKYMKITQIIILFLAVTLTFAPTSTAWTWDTHSAVVDQVYHSMPISIQSKLNLSAMRDGSNDPDQVFHDYRDHSYPYSYNKAVYYLNLAKSYYKEKKYNQASKDYGIASHYISDTFSAPHCVSGETSTQHQAYEKTGTKLTPHITVVNGDLKTLMQNGYISGKTDWNYWEKTKNSYYVQKDLNLATSVTYKAIMNSLGSNSSPIITSPTNSKKYVGNKDTKKFHLISCRYASQISSANKIYFSSRQDAINHGYIPCKICKP